MPSDSPIPTGPHHQSAKEIIARCAVVTLSDTRTEETDVSGRRIRELLLADGHQITAYQVIPDEPARLEKLLRELLASDQIDAIITNGGTGIARRDQTLSAVERLIETPLPGFGELFRMLSWEQVGAAAMLSRAIAGVAAGGKKDGIRKPIFSLPGSTKAVELAVNKLILPEIRHILWELRK